MDQHTPRVRVRIPGGSAAVAQPLQVVHQQATADVGDDGGSGDGGAASGQLGGRFVQPGDDVENGDSVDGDVDNEYDDDDAASEDDDDDTDAREHDYGDTPTASDVEDGTGVVQYTLDGPRYITARRRRRSRTQSYDAPPDFLGSLPWPSASTLLREDRDDSRGFEVHARTAAAAALAASYTASYAASYTASSQEAASPLRESSVAVAQLVRRALGLPPSRLRPEVPLHPDDARDPFLHDAFDDGAAAYVCNDQWEHPLSEASLVRLYLVDPDAATTCNVTCSFSREPVTRVTPVRVRVRAADDGAGEGGAATATGPTPPAPPARRKRARTATGYAADSAR